MNDPTNEPKTLLGVDSSLEGGMRTDEGKEAKVFAGERRRDGEEQIDELHWYDREAARRTGVRVAAARRPNWQTPAAAGSWSSRDGSLSATACLSDRSRLRGSIFYPFQPF